MPVAMTIQHKIDPVADIIADVGDYSGIKLLFNSVLIATYVRPIEVKTSGGVILPAKVVDEDRYQSKVGLVLAMGRRAFVDEPNRANPILFYGDKVNAFDWVVYRPSEGFKMQIGKRECRMLQDVFIKAVLRGPDDIY